jgi:uncharacterized protein YjiS (DUF1127 family)
MYISTLLRAFAEWRKYRAAVRELSTLDDRILNDIGLNGTTIREAARTGARR